MAKSRRVSKSSKSEEPKEAAKIVEKPAEIEGTKPRRKSTYKADDEKSSVVEDINLETSKSSLWNRLPSDIKPGAWVNLYSGYREPEIRAKLSVIIPETEMLVFVDRGGMKSAEKPIDEFLNELDEGLSTVVIEHSVFDKALSSVISNLSAY